MAIALKGTRLNNSIGNRPRSMVSARGTAIPNALPSINPESAAKVNHPTIQHKTPAQTTPNNVGGNPGGIKLGHINEKFYNGFEKQASIGGALGTLVRKSGNAITKTKGLLSSGLNKAEHASNVLADKTHAAFTGASQVPGRVSQWAKNTGSAGIDKTKGFLAKQKADFLATKNPVSANFKTNNTLSMNPQKAPNLAPNVRGAHGLSPETSVHQATRSGNLKSTIENTINKNQAAEHKFNKAVSSGDLNPKTMGANNSGVGHSIDGESLRNKANNAVQKDINYRASAEAAQKAQQANTVPVGAPQSHGLSGAERKQEFINSRKARAEAAQKAEINHQQNMANQNAALKQERAGHKESKTFADKANQHFNIGFNKAKKQWNSLSSGQKMGVVGAGALGTGLALRGGSGKDNN